MKTCERCLNPVQPPRRVCNACLQAAHNRRRRARYVRAMERPPQEADMGPPWPLLLPPDAEAREKARLQARIREAFADGLSEEDMVERFGHRALYLARVEGICRPAGKRMAFGSPAL